MHSGLEASVQAAEGFFGEGRVLGATPHGGGHIHDSFVVTYRDQSAVRRALLQRCNAGVFRDLKAVMHNVVAVTEHLRARGYGAPRVLHTAAGAPYLEQAAGLYRAFDFIEGSRPAHRGADLEEAAQAGGALAAFELALGELDPAQLRVTIPGFHDGPARLAALRSAVTADAVGRVAMARDALDLIEARSGLATVLTDAAAAGALPQRIAHGDAKLDNLLFDAASGRALCFVDLDTVMPGLWLHDIGDLLRSAACAGAEDERERGRIAVHEQAFARLLQGYTARVGGALVASEWELLATSAKLFVLELATRFLTDFLQGDRYFKVQRPLHNLERARAQLALVQALERAEPRLQRLVADLRLRP